MTALFRVNGTKRERGRCPVLSQIDDLKAEAAGGVRVQRCPPVRPRPRRHFCRPQTLRRTGRSYSGTTLGRSWRRTFGARCTTLTVRQSPRRIRAVAARSPRRLELRPGPTNRDFVPGHVSAVRNAELKVGARLPAHRLALPRLLRRHRRRLRDQSLRPEPRRRRRPGFARGCGCGRGWEGTAAAGQAAVRPGGRGDVRRGRRAGGAPAHGACTRPTGSGRRTCGARSSPGQRPDSRRRCVPGPWHR